MNHLGIDGTGQLVFDAGGSKLGAGDDDEEEDEYEEELEEDVKRKEKKEKDRMVDITGLKGKSVLLFPI